MQKFFLIILFISLTGFINGPVWAQTDSYSAETIAYFKEIALKSEYGAKSACIRKWTQDVKIFIAGAADPLLKEEVTTIINDLNSLLQEIKISQVSRKEQANFVIFFGSANAYTQRYEPNARRVVKGNLACFWVHKNNRNEIYKGSMYLDTERLKAKDTQFHLLREELTQSLGLMNDSMRYRESIFYQKWTRTREFAPIDQQLIRLLYHPKIKPGMTTANLNTVLRSL